MGIKCRKAVAITCFISLMAGMLTGCGAFTTVLGLSENKPTTLTDANDLESGKAYVLRDDRYYTCIAGDYNFKKKELEEVTEYPRSIWVDSAVDAQIPTVKAGDKLVYVSDESVPDSIVFERFADYGYTIGVSNMQADLGGHYYITFSDVEEDDYKYFIDMKSDASQLTELEAVTKLYLDKVGSDRVTKENVSDGGTVLGLKKDKTYTCEFYTGTYHQAFNLKANIHSFGSFERFVSHDYEFMHSNSIEIEVPDYFVSGYYFVQGVGLFRYVSQKDADRCNGRPYDASINWNEPMSLYNEDGTVKFEPGEPEGKVNINENSDPGDEGNVDVQIKTDTTKTEDSGGKETS